MKIINGQRQQIYAEYLPSVVNSSQFDFNVFLWGYDYKIFIPKYVPKVNNQMSNFAILEPKLLTRLVLWICDWQRQN